MKPCSARILHTSRPERRRSLPNRDIEGGYIDLRVKASCDLLRRCCFEEEREGFLEVGACLLDRIPLAGDVEFRAQRDEPVLFALDHCRNPLDMLHEIKATPKPVGCRRDSLHSNSPVESSAGISATISTGPGEVAQLAEHAAENRGVGGPIPPLHT